VIDGGDLVGIGPLVVVDREVDLVSFVDGEDTLWGAGLVAASDIVPTSIGIADLEATVVGFGNRLATEDFLEAAIGSELTRRRELAAVGNGLVIIGLEVRLAVLAGVRLVDEPRIVLTPATGVSKHSPQAAAWRIPSKYIEACHVSSTAWIQQTIPSSLSKLSDGVPWRSSSSSILHCWQR